MFDIILSKHKYRLTGSDIVNEVASFHSQPSIKLLLSRCV